MSFTAKDVKDMRERTGMGLMECKRILIGRDLRADLAGAETIEHLKPILRVLIDDRFPDNDRA